MLNTSPGQILVADYEGVYVIKMVGDVRLTLCLSFDQYIERLFEKKDLCNILFDLSEAEGLDSTTLGLIAKIAIKSNQLKQIQPLVICDRPAIVKLLLSMAINTVCEIIKQPPKDYGTTSRFLGLEACEMENGLLKEKVVEAHYVLMSLNETNKQTFTDLVQTLDKH